MALNLFISSFVTWLSAGVSGWSDDVSSSKFPSLIIPFNADIKSSDFNFFTNKLYLFNKVSVYAVFILSTTFPKSSELKLFNTTLLEDPNSIFCSTLSVIVFLAITFIFTIPL